MTKQTDIPVELQLTLKNGEPNTVFMKLWDQHVIDRDEIESFTTIVGDKLYHVKPKDDEIFMPFMEINGDHSMNWILSIHRKTGKELYRKNTRTVDMVNWKLSSSSTKSK